VITRFQKNLVILSLVVAFSGCASNQEANQPSFDCTKANSSVEFAICKSPKLAVLDKELSEVYKSRKEVLSDNQINQSQLVVLQRYWLKYRSFYCPEAEEDCLANLYLSRIRDIKDYASGKDVFELEGEDSRVNEALKSQIKRAVRDRKIGDEKMDVTLARICDDLDKKKNLTTLSDRSLFLLCYDLGKFSKEENRRAKIVLVAQDVVKASKPETWPFDYASGILGRAWVQQNPKKALIYFGQIRGDHAKSFIPSIVRSYLLVGKPVEALKFLEKYPKSKKVFYESANVFLWLIVNDKKNKDKYLPELILALEAHFALLVKELDSIKKIKDDNTEIKDLVIRAELLVSYYKPSKKNKGNEEKYKRYNLISAKLGSTSAQVRQAVIHQKDSGDDGRASKALYWFMEAAKQGDKHAQKSVGMLFGLGRGVPQDFVRAFVWLNVAAANGDRDAAAYRDGLADDMTKSDISKAQKITNECLRSDYHRCE
jgi:uncharacterized protein